MVRGVIKCYCGNIIQVANDVVKCERCGREFLYKRRSGKFVLRFDPNLRKKQTD